MLRTVALSALGIGVLMVLTGGSALATPTPGDCQNDSKLIGPIELSTDDRPGTWWQLTSDGFDAAGFTDDAAKEALIESIFATEFATLADAVTALVDAVRGIDRNGNGFVCASRVRGTRGWIDLPAYDNYFFNVTDDRHVKG